MRTPILPLALLLFSAPTYAQLYAGEVPEGSTSYDPNIDLTLNTTFSADSADVEFDCDDFMDAWAVLVRGYPEVDAPNIAMLDFVDGDIEVCMDLTGGFQQRPKYYNFGETLDCSGGFEWQIADQLVLGDLGGFLAIGPWSIDNKYIAYRQGSTVGWMLLSFELASQTIRLQIHDLLPVCQIPLAIASYAVSAPVTLFPNPSNGGAIRVESSNALRNVEVLDATGRIIAQYHGSVRTIASPEIAGCYLVQATHADGRRSVTRLVQH